MPKNTNKRRSWKKPIEFDIRVFTEDPEKWDEQLCLETLVKLIMKAEQGGIDHGNQDKTDEERKKNGWGE